MRKFFFILAGACALFIGSANLSDAVAQPHGYRRPPPARMVPPPHRQWHGGRRVHGPRCVMRPVRVWNGRHWVTRSQRVCRW